MVKIWNLRLQVSVIYNDKQFFFLIHAVKRIRRPEAFVYIFFKEFLNHISPLPQKKIAYFSPI